MRPHAALVDVPAPGVGGPGGEAREAGAGEGAHRVGTGGVPPAVVGEVPVRALVDVDTALVGCVVAVPRAAVTPPAAHRVDAGRVGPAVGGGVGGVGRTLVNIATTCRRTSVINPKYGRAGSLTDSPSKSIVYFLRQIFNLQTINYLSSSE